jgi:hypothetical protein
MWTAGLPSPYYQSYQEAVGSEEPETSPDIRPQKKHITGYYRGIKGGTELIFLSLSNNHVSLCTDL